MKDLPVPLQSHLPQITKWCISNRSLSPFFFACLSLPNLTKLNCENCGREGMSTSLPQCYLWPSNAICEPEGRFFSVWGIFLSLSCFQQGVFSSSLSADYFVQSISFLSLWCSFSMKWIGGNFSHFGFINIRYIWQCHLLNNVQVLV